MVKNMHVMWEKQVKPASGQALRQEDPLEKGMAIHSNILAWRFPWEKSLAGHSPWGHKESDTTE